MKDSLVTSLVRVLGGTIKGCIWNAYMNRSLPTEKKEEKIIFYCASGCVYSLWQSLSKNFVSQKFSFMLGDFWHQLVWYQLDLYHVSHTPTLLKLNLKIACFHRYARFSEALTLKINELKFVLTPSGWRSIWRSLWCCETPWHEMCKFQWLLVKRSQWWTSASSTESKIKFQILVLWSECCDLWMLCMLCPHINHINISLHLVEEEYPGTITCLRSTRPPDIRNGLQSSSVNSVAPDNNGNISKAVNKGEDTHLPPGNDPQKPAGGIPNWKCQKRREKI